MTPEAVRLATEALELSEKATPGPWVEFYDKGKPCSVMPAMRPGDICNTRKSTPEDARFITFARTALPELARVVLAMSKAYAVTESLQTASAALKSAHSAGYAKCQADVVAWMRDIGKNDGPMAAYVRRLAIRIVEEDEHVGAASKGAK